MLVEKPNVIAAVRSVPVWQRAITLFSTVFTACLLVLILHWGRPVLIPIALAVLLTFLLSPLVKLLHRRGCSQTVAAFLAVSLAGVCLVGLCWLMSTQFSGMLQELPRNTEKIKAKLKTLKELGSGPTRDRILGMIEEISGELYSGAEKPKNATSTAEEEGEGDAVPQPGKIIVSTERNNGWLSLSSYVGSALEVLATLAFVMILLVFFLIERVDLRDRIVLLAGRAKLAVTSKTVEDISDRISRYIVMVALINGGFGVVLTVGLLALQVPFAPVWGFLAALARFIPYIGPWVGAVFPITMAFATSNGWSQVLSVLAFVAVVELVTNNVVEPLLFGHTTGVSPTGLLISAAFWLYLWGPVGLILSAPFAACLVVLGKKIPQLSFLYILLGDKPALSPDYSFYQRLMLGETHEAADLAVKHLKLSPPETVYDELLVPVLNYSRRDVLRGYSTDEDHLAVMEGVRCTLKKIDETLLASHMKSAGAAEAVRDTDVVNPVSPLKILGCPAYGEADVVALEMLKALLDSNRCELEIISLEVLTSELVMRVSTNPPAMVYITSIPPEAVSHAVYLCKRLRKVAPAMPIIIGRLNPKRQDRHQIERLELAGATCIAATLLESRHQLQARLTLTVPAADEAVTASGSVATAVATLAPSTKPLDRSSV